jgi:hypothetical protein
VPVVPHGGRYPATGSEITYANFRQLLEYPEFRGAVAPLMAEWFGYSVTDTPVGVRLVNPAGEALDTLWIHLRIQADGPRHRALYQLAMSLWRWARRAEPEVHRTRPRHLFLIAHWFLLQELVSSGRYPLAPLARAILDGTHDALGPLADALEEADDPRAPEVRTWFKT